MADLLQWARNEACTGILVVRRSHREKRIFLRNGNVEACFSDDPSEYFGHYLTLNGYLDKRKVIFALTFCQRRGVKLGVALQELELLETEEVQEALREQISNSIYDIFLWRRGLFYFEQQPLPEERLLPKPISTMYLTMEGTRWVDEYARIRNAFPHDNILLHRGRSGPKKEKPLQQEILRQIDGERTLGDVYKALKGSYFRFLEATYDLAAREVVEVEVVGSEAELETSREIGIYDLLLEQAAEEEDQMFRRRLALPVDLLEKFYPIWIKRPRETEPGVRSEEGIAFLSKIDGNTSLKDLLSGESGPSEIASENLGFQLRSGSLALVPYPLRELSSGRGGGDPSELLTAWMGRGATPRKLPD